jgi:hypothetical protein
MRILVVFLLGAAVGFGAHLFAPPEPPFVLTAVPVHVPVALPFPWPVPTAVIVPVPAIARPKPGVRVRIPVAVFSRYIVDQR